MGGGGVTYALEASANEVDTNREWKPEGNIVAQGEDGVPWELYENGYLLFKPESGKDTLSNPNEKGLPSWKLNYGGKIKAIDFSDKVYLPENSHRLFANQIINQYLSQLQYIDVSKIDTSKVTDMSNLFDDVRIYNKIDLSNWDTSKVTNMQGIFGNSDFTEIKASNWDTSKVTNMQGMFHNASELKKIDVSKWNTSKVTNMRSLFFNTRIEGLDLTKWNTSNVTDMSDMFYSSVYNKLDLNNWNTSKVINMARMFYGTQIPELDLSNWDTSNVEDMDSMFEHSQALHTLNLKNWQMEKIVEFSYYNGMFEDMPLLRKLTIGSGFFKKTGSKHPFEYLDKHSYGTLYSDTWEKLDGTKGPMSVRDWASNYMSNAQEYSGTWVRNKNLANKIFINFETYTDEKISPIITEEISNITLPMPTIEKKSFGDSRYKFIGWSKDTNDIVQDITKEIKLGDSFILYAKWQEFYPKKYEYVKIPFTTIYQGDKSLDKGNRNEEEGQVGEKKIVTTYQATPITGELTNPTITENIVTPMVPKIIKVGTKPTEVESRIELPITVKQTDTLVKGKERITQGRPRVEKEITEYTVNEITGDVTESKRIEIVDEGTPTIKEIGTREPTTIIRDVNGKELTDDELPNYTNPETNPTNTTDNGDLVYIVHKIVTKYKGNDTLELNKQVVEKDGKTDGVKLIQVGTKPTVTTIERDNKQIKQTTTYIVNEDTGKLTPNTTEEIIGDVKPATSNGTEAPLTFELLEYTNPISTNTPIDDNGNLVLPPVVDIPEYKNTSEQEKYPNEKRLQPVTNNNKLAKEKNTNEESKQEITTNNVAKSESKKNAKETNIDTVNKTEPNDTVIQKQTLPKTNTLHSTAYILGLLLSTVGFTQRKKD